MASKEKTETTAFWKKFLVLLAKREWNQRDFSRVTGIPPQTVQRWKKAPPGAPLLRKTARTFGVSADELMDDSDQERAQSRKLRLVSDLGTSEETLGKAREALRRLQNNRTSYPSSSPRGIRMDESFGELLTSTIARALTKDQLLGLALLIDGEDVEPWRVRAALELIFGRERDE